MKTIIVSPDDLREIKLKTVVQSTYYMLNLKFAIYSDQEKILTYFDKMYARFKVDSNESAYKFYVITKENILGQPFVLADKEVHLLCDNEFCFQYAYMVILNKLKTLFKDIFILHAGVVSYDGKGVVIVGSSNFGKTTLTLELVKKGFKFLSDEFCSIHQETQEIYSFPRSIGISKGTPDREKQWIDIENFKKGCIENRAIGKYIFFLKGMRSSDIQQSEKLIDVILSGEDEELISELQAIPGTKLINKHETNCYLVYRFGFYAGSSFTKYFDEICERHSQYILFSDLISTEVPYLYFNRDPFIEKIPKSTAALQLMKNLLNHSQYLKAPSKTLLSLGKIVKQIECYNLYVGKIDKTVDLIINLVQ
jgi:hypothetical protein